MGPGTWWPGCRDTSYNEDLAGTEVPICVPSKGRSFGSWSAVLENEHPRMNFTVSVSPTVFSLSRGRMLHPWDTGCLALFLFY